VRRAAAALLALAAACATVPAGPGGWAFPASFDANQVVRIEGRDGSWELVASLRRRGDDYEVTLFDPVFSAPVLTASLRGGQASERVLAPAGAGVRPGDGERLVETLREIYGERYPAEEGGRTAAGSLRVHTALSGIAGEAGCRFPGAIEIRPRAGPVERLEVRTIEVRCGGE